jgi:hypothetical protein
MYDNSETLRLKCLNHIEDKKKLRLKLKKLQARLKRKEKKYEGLERFRDMFWSKLDDCPVLRSLVLRLLAPTNKMDDTLRSFSRSLHYYSAKAHSFVRSSLNSLIPNGRVIRKWSENFRVEPGFIDPCLSHIEKMVRVSKFPVYCSLQFDEIHIREQVIASGASFIGFVDYGEFYRPKDPKRIANSAIVFMAVAINSNWKVILSNLFYFNMSSINICMVSVFVRNIFI